MNVNIATKDLMKNKTSKAISNQFMRGRNHMNECDICGKEFPKMSSMKQHIESVHDRLVILVFEDIFLC